VELDAPPLPELDALELPDVELPELCPLDELALVEVDAPVTPDEPPLPGGNPPEDPHANNAVTRAGSARTPESREGERRLSTASDGTRFGAGAALPCGKTVAPTLPKTARARLAGPLVGHGVPRHGVSDHDHDASADPSDGGALLPRGRRRGALRMQWEHRGRELFGDHLGEHEHEQLGQLGQLGQRGKRCVPDEPARAGRRLRRERAELQLHAGPVRRQQPRDVLGRGLERGDERHGVRLSRTAAHARQPVRPVLHRDLHVRLGHV
jgi:hypothetical protein